MNAYSSPILGQTMHSPEILPTQSPSCRASAKDAILKVHTGKKSIYKKYPLIPAVLATGTLFINVVSIGFLATESEKLADQKWVYGVDMATHALFGATAAWKMGEQAVLKYVNKNVKEGDEASLKWAESIKNKVRVSSMVRNGINCLVGTGLVVIEGANHSKHQDMTESNLLIPAMIFGGINALESFGSSVNAFNNRSKPAAYAQGTPSDPLSPLTIEVLSGSEDSQNNLIGGPVTSEGRLGEEAVAFSPTSLNSEAGLVSPALPQTLGSKSSPRGPGTRTFDQSSIISEAPSRNPRPRSASLPPTNMQRSFSPAPR